MEVPKDGDSIAMDHCKSVFCHKNKRFLRVVDKSRRRLEYTSACVLRHGYHCFSVSFVLREPAYITADRLSHNSYLR